MAVWLPFWRQRSATAVVSGEGAVGGGEVVGQVFGDGWGGVVAAGWFGSRFVRGGYLGGLDAKRALLTLEAAA